MKKLLIIGCLFSFAIGVHGQTIPEAPEMISVSVLPLTDTVTIKWNLSPTPGVLGYIIHEHVYGGLSGWGEDSIRLENSPTATQSIFKYPKVRKGPVMFYVAAYYYTAQGISISNPGTVPYHKTIFMQLKYDSCTLTTNVIWTKYVGWGNKFGSYTVFQMVNGGTQQIVKDNISANDTSLVVPVDPNKNYIFYVWATNNDLTANSMSNDSSIYSKTPVPPSFISADYASFNSNSSNPVKIRFTIDPSSELKKYQLYTSDNADAGFTPVNPPVVANSDSIVMQDNLTNSSPKYYRLDVLSNCGNSVYASNIATAMILKVSVQSNEVNLVWNEYKGWDKGVQQYNIYRKIGNDNPQLIGNTGTNNYTDNVSKLIGQQYSGNICYYVEAVSNPNNLGKVNQSLSSNFCIDLSESVFIPNAFTPNGDGLNDEFKPSFAFLPAEFVLVVYNRYGFKVFETTDSLKGWDGTVGGGKKAPEGSYVYFIKFSSQTGKTIEKKGNFSLIYP